MTLKISIKELVRSYVKWVSENPQTVGDVETTVKWVSYFIAGRISDSSIISELIYALSNILVILNDRIIENANNVGPTSNTRQSKFAYQLKLLLTTIEYSEVLFELSARKLFGVRGKWIIITLVQVIKAVGRLLLIKHFSERIIRAPLIQNLDRKKTVRNATEDFIGNEASFSFKLKRSGRIIRKIESSPPIQYRNFDLIQPENQNTDGIAAKTDIAAEVIYVCKPIVHLLTCYLWGYKSWRSYSAAAAMDLMSLHLYRQNTNLSKEQKIEVSKRCMHMLLYFIRSPVYERSTQGILQSTLKSVSSNIPFSRFILESLIQYIPQWQDTYFYMWST